VYYAASTYSGGVEAKGGTATGGAVWAGQDGTVVFIDTSQNILYPGNSFRFEEIDSPFAFTEIILNNSQSSLDGTVTLSATDLHINGSSTLILNGNETLNVNSLYVTNNSQLTVIPEGKIYLNLPTLNIDPTSTITAEGKGYSAGPGSGTANSGGGYGGHGGSSYSDNGGIVYGSALQPVDLGSGDGYATRGGGAIRLIVSDRLIVDGQITANGVGDGGGNAGSGGSIYITVPTLAGSGNLMANGGIGSGHWGCGGGSGGRIAVYYAASTYSGGVEAKGGSGYGGGQEGTVVFIDTSRNIMYPGYSFRFDEIDSPFAFTSYS
jgi:hypothetical protein